MQATNASGQANQPKEVGTWVIISTNGEILSEIKPASLRLKWLKVGEQTLPERNGNFVRRIA
jgi:hypothetical protein